LLLLATPFFAQAPLALDTRFVKRVKRTIISLFTKVGTGAVSLNAPISNRCESKDGAGIDRAWGPHSEGVAEKETGGSSSVALGSRGPETLPHQMRRLTSTMCEVIRKIRVFQNRPRIQADCGSIAYQPPAGQR
jgi:hypothetical protein